MNVEIRTVPLSQIELNPNNPRTIYNRDMERLVKSLTDFPEMMELREIVVDENMVVLGGNMRLLALRKIGADECVAKIVTGLSEEQKKEFIIKDNVGFGEWEWDVLANEWDVDKLTQWGLDIPDYEPKSLRRAGNNIKAVSNLKHE